MMSSQNLATCIAPSLIRPKQRDSQDDLMLTRDVINYMIENCVQIFGEDVISLFKEVPSERSQEDSDTDSFHSTLSTFGGVYLKWLNFKIDQIIKSFHIFLTD